ncbi:MAG TPA: hypothetical protein VN521_01605 [Negativicutes bacterium]|nr:hypothetical protein [Negativicutes bacterium]
MAGVAALSTEAARGNIPSAYSQPQGAASPGPSAQGRDGYWENRLGPAYQVELSSPTDTARNAAETDRLKRTGKIECQTCKQRRYQDGSNDPGVSFKAPGYISPESSAAVVSAHEQEHVSREQASASSEGRKVVAQSVRLFTAVCPECGRVYVSGGETRTTTVADNSRQETPQNGVDLVA